MALPYAVFNTELIQMQHYLADQQKNTTVFLGMYFMVKD
ncbi:hypothetical protein C427_1341 [Paraglaciecola psychrophila 170]|uniref:Uncharacterized protein n=1 Tax=Paraglaciecola psychrophila 170 TaxID=1129794 RepID=K7A821_9ALTE|nr:hypothetical protein C427_1341 [Paraglaciecola psychrophila 170]GAC38452.1 hypothetical protein GPSY_2841 [Paraglaciecola psychrophila 170]